MTKTSWTDYYIQFLGGAQDTPSQEALPLVPSNQNPYVYERSDRPILFYWPIFLYQFDRISLNLDRYYWLAWVDFLTFLDWSGKFSLFERSNWYVWVDCLYSSINLINCFPFNGFGCFTWADCLISTNQVNNFCTLWVILLARYVLELNLPRVLLWAGNLD